MHGRSLTQQRSGASFGILRRRPESRAGDCLHACTGECAPDERAVRLDAHARGHSGRVLRRRAACEEAAEADGCSRRAFAWLGQQQRPHAVTSKAAPAAQSVPDAPRASQVHRAVCDHLGAHHARRYARAFRAMHALVRCSMRPRSSDAAPMAVYTRQPSSVQASTCKSSARCSTVSSSIARTRHLRGAPRLLPLCRASSGADPLRAFESGSAAWACLSVGHVAGFMGRTCRSPSRRGS
jgi:hypothetical protein